MDIPRRLLHSRVSLFLPSSSDIHHLRYRLADVQCVSLEYLILFVGFFVKLYTERTTSQGGSTSTWNIPAGFLSFEVRVKWGAPQSAGQTSEGNASAAIPTAQGRRDEESGRPA